VNGCGLAELVVVLVVDEGVGCCFCVGTGREREWCGMESEGLMSK